MNKDLTKSQKIAKNTALLYIRMLAIMVINLYTVRVVLLSLGVEDFGIFNVVAGVVTMLHGACTVLQTAIQRYYSFSLGENDSVRLNQVYSVSIVIFIVLSIIVLILGESVGLWFVNAKLVIPDERIIAANWVYHFSLLSFVVTMFQVPYSSALIAHEDMGAYSIITTAEYALKLLLAFSIQWVPVDKLAYYGFSLLVAQASLLLAYIVFSKKNYAEIVFRKNKEKKLYREILSFSGWSLFGSLASVGMNQVNTILVNIFFGPIVNAARAIAIQVNSAINAFSNNFIMAVRSPMIKSYAEKDYVYLNNVFSLSNKFVLYFLLMICIPLIIEMSPILQVWLKTSDPQTVLFSRLIVVYAVIVALGNPISIIIQATGKVREYHLTVEAFTCLCPFITYFLYKIGCPAYTTFIAMIGCILLSHIMRMICLKRFYTQYSVKDYIVRLVIPAILITIAVSVALFLIHQSITLIIVRVFVTFTVSVLLTLSLAYFLALSSDEKGMIKVFIRKFIKK